MDAVIQGRAQQDAEATRVRRAVEALVTAGRDVVVYTTRALQQVTKWVGGWMRWEERGGGGGGGGWEEGGGGGGENGSMI